MKSVKYGIKETTSIHTGRKDADAEWAAPTLTCGGLKCKRFISGARSTSTTPGALAQGYSAKKISPHNFWLQNQVGIE